MSKYTTEVRYLCETLANLNESVGYSNVNEVLNASAMKVFDFDFPIFEENHRKPLCIKILRHYYTREISEETVGLWKLKLEAKMNEIMPYYNQLYETETFKYDPITDVDYVRSGYRDVDANSEGSSSGDNVNREMFSNTPQGSLQNVENGEYLTTATKISNETSASTESTNSSAEEYEERITGKQGATSYASLVRQYRKNILNIDTQIIDELKPLFFNLW